MVDGSGNEYESVTLATKVRSCSVVCRLKVRSKSYGPCDIVQRSGPNRQSVFKSGSQETSVRDLWKCHPLGSGFIHLASPIIRSVPVAVCRGESRRLVEKLCHVIHDELRRAFYNRPKRSEVFCSACPAANLRLSLVSVCADDQAHDPDYR